MMQPSGFRTAAMVQMSLGILLNFVLVPLIVNYQLESLAVICDLCGTCFEVHKGGVLLVQCWAVG